MSLFAWYFFLKINLEVLFKPPTNQTCGVPTTQHHHHDHNQTTTHQPGMENQPKQKRVTERKARSAEPILSY